MTPSHTPTDELERLEAQITPGEWHVEEGANSHCFDLIVYGPRGEFVAFSDDVDAHAIALVPALLRELIARRKADEWQPIETAPKDGLIDIWIANSDGTGRRVSSCYYDRICDEWRTSQPSVSVAEATAKVNRLRIDEDTPAEKDPGFNAGLDAALRALKGGEE